jgi:DNA polymerase
MDADGGALTSDGATANDPAALTALLDWYVAAGVDAVLGEEPVDRFAEERARLATARPSAPAVPKSPPPPPPAQAPPRLPIGDEAIEQARSTAASATSLAELEALVRAFDGCALKLTARSTVFSDGNPAARVMFVGEAPGQEEDQQGKPFVGRSGKLLDLMLAAIGLDRSKAYIANTIYWRPPGNRNPSDLEVNICRPFITRQIELVDPEIIVVVGAQAAKALLGAPGAAGIMKLRGRWLGYPMAGREVRCLPMLHPAGLLRNPLNKRLAWRDMLALKKALDGATGRGIEPH